MGLKTVAPPVGGGSIVIKGRTYTCTDGATVNMPEADAQIAHINGWSMVADWYAESPGGVVSVAGRTGAVTLTKTDVALGNVTNTSDANKPVSTAQQTAIDAAAGAVTSVAGRAGAVVLTKTDVGLANVDNVADAGKPVSTAQQTALDQKANGSGVSASIVIPAVGTITVVNGVITAFA